PKNDRVFYSLYMHLLPLGNDGADRDPYFAQVPWFQQLMRRRHGTFTKLYDEAREPAGCTFWSKAPVPSSPAPGAKFEVYDRGKPVEAVAADGSPRWFFKAGPVDFGEVIAGLDAGKLVTFNEPFFAVGGGEALGLVAPVALDGKGGNKG